MSEPVAATAERPRLVQTGPTTWVEAEWCKGLCCFCLEPLAPGDTIACTEHRRAIDAEPMPWDRHDGADRD